MKVLQGYYINNGNKFQAVLIKFENVFQGVYLIDGCLNNFWDKDNFIEEAKPEKQILKITDFFGQELSEMNITFKE